MKVLRKLLGLLRRRERIQLAVIGLAMLLMAVLETVGVASIMPFMQIVSDPGVIDETPLLAEIYDRFGFASTKQFLMFAGIALLTIIAVNNGFSALTIWMMHRFAWSQNHRLSKRLLEDYLARPYEFFLGRNTSELGKNLLSEAQTVVTGILLPILRVAARSLVILLIVALLAFVDPGLALLVTVVLGGAYGCIYVGLRQKQQSLGRRRVDENSHRYRIAVEALMGIKTVKVLGRERDFLQRFKTPSWSFSQTTASNQIVSRLPRYALETVAFGSIVLIVLYYLQVGNDVSRVLPVISLYAFAGYRLMPALNELFASVIHIRFNTAALDDLCRDLRIETGATSVERSLEDAQTRADLKSPFEDSIVLDRVTFRYPGTSEPALSEVTIEVLKNETVGLVGATGSGKTTAVDLILGLLCPTEGHLRIDGVKQTVTTLPLWRRQCGYVPQDIFISDGTIRSNIAFGLPDDQIDDSSVFRAAEIAQIRAFIEQLPQGFNSLVGERGIRLSGGQRQRIGIARALYHDPAVLVLDEATNSLDGATESAVLTPITQMARCKTIIIVAHRLRTVRQAHRLFLFQNGRVVTAGTYEQLQRDSRTFQRLTAVPEPVRT